MKLFEYEAKEVFKRNGIPVPSGILIYEPETGKGFFSENSPVVIKAQILSGGRGKAGGIKFASTIEEYEKETVCLLGSMINDLPVNSILVEPKLDIIKEFYAGYTINRSKAKIVLMLSASGGVDIETLASETPEAIHKYEIDINTGPDPVILRELSFKIAPDTDIAEKVFKVINDLYNVFTRYECEVAEINPLVLTSSGDLLAADARISIYDEAASKHPDYIKEEDSYSDLEKEAMKQGLGYVMMDGDIGVIGNGAGLNMATLDIITYFGGKPANFLEVSGRTYHKAREAVGIILKNPNVRILFGNFFGCISRCDVIAMGLAEAVRKNEINVPVVIAMRGTGAEEGVLTLKEVGLDDVYADDIDAGRRVAELLKGM
ncbi:MAG: ADP-forming succinate--CoA ligase subunit beta [Elusimicrobiota bacterium]